MFGLGSEILIFGRTVAEPILGESPMLEMAGVDAANVTMCRPLLERISRVTFDPLGTGVQTSLGTRPMLELISQSGSLPR